MPPARSSACERSAFAPPLKPCMKPHRAFLVLALLGRLTAAQPASPSPATPASPAEIDPGREASRLELAAAQQTAARKPVVRQPHGNGTVAISGELKQWHKITLELAGPFAAETDTAPNPFTDYALNVTF